VNILLSTNGSPHSARALDLGVHIAKKAASTVDILVAAERDREEDARQLAQEAAAELAGAGISVHRIERTSPLAEAVVHQAQAAPYDLVIIGSRGRRGVVRLLRGSVALHVTEHVPASVLVVKGRPRDLKRFLVCSSAGPVSDHTVRFASSLAGVLEASVTLIHVMSQVALSEQALCTDLGATAEELIQCGSREGIHLRQMLDLLAEEGQAGRAVVRHGLVRDEIIAEAQEGRYDLLVAGSHVTPGLNARLVDDLSTEILLAANRPVLVVRYARPE
jgi:nucleotide-binding universal stress UspA family protein